MVYNANTGELDPKFFSTWLKKMDEDVAAAFVLSGIALDKTKILEAFDTACQVMHIRSVDKANKYKKTLAGQGNKTLEDIDLLKVPTEENAKSFLHEVDEFINSILGTKKKKKKDPGSKK